MASRIALLCDPSGAVTLALHGHVEPGTSLESLADPASRGKVRQFLDLLRREGSAAGWEWNLLSESVPIPVSFSGLRIGTGFAVVGQDPPSGLDEIARLNNELVNSQRELARQNAALERANRELANFAAVVAHDLRAPLRNIRQLIGLFQEKAPQLLDQRAAVWLQHIVENAARMQKRIDDSLAYARMENAAALFEAVPLNEVVDAVATPEVHREELPVTWGVRSQLELLFQNLIENALAYRGPDPPSIRISAQLCGGRWRLAVRDNGRGIEPADHLRIFEMFHHAGDAAQGTGIGLATCRQVVRRHGGEIWVESVPGAGSTFYFTLPRS